MKRKALRAGALAAVLAVALVPASPAQAGPLALLHHTATGTVNYYDGTTDVLALVVSNLSPSGNAQLVEGFVFSQGVFAGTLFQHVYDSTADEGHYWLQGTFANGASILAQVVVFFDRYGSARTIELQGTIADQPFTTGPIKIT